MPSFLRHMEKKRASSDVRVGVHTEEVRGISDPGGILGSLLEKRRTVSPRVPVQGGDVDAVSVPSASTGRAPSGEGEMAKSFFPSRHVAQGGNASIVFGGVDNSLGGKDGNATLLGSGGGGHVVGAPVSSFARGEPWLGGFAPEAVVATAFRGGRVAFIGWQRGSGMPRLLQGHNAGLIPLLTLIASRPVGLKGSDVEADDTDGRVLTRPVPSLVSWISSQASGVAPSSVMEVVLPLGGCGCTRHPPSRE